jgi:WD40 repeat protein
MSTNNIIHNNQDEIMNHPPTPPLSLVISFGNILTKFPEFLLQVLPYIADRIIWNSIASSNKIVYKKTKEDLPPWPINFKLCVPGYCVLFNFSNPVWSPDGTQIACIAGDDNHKTSYGYRIVIFDQRRGLLRFRRHGDESNNNNNNGNEIGWIAHEDNFEIPNLKFSPDGSFLVSVSRNDGQVKIWDYNTTGYYLQLQEWNINEELDADSSCEYIKIDVSPCSRYVAILSGRHVLLKDVQNNGKTIKSALLPEDEHGCQVMFSTIDGRHSIFISISAWGKNLKIWCPYDIDDEGDDPDTNASLTTILEPSDVLHFAMSHDKSMLAIYTEEEDDDKVMLYYVNNDNKSTTRSRLALKHSFPGVCSSIRFTPDDNYIYTNLNRLAFWNITTGREITDNIIIKYNKNKKVRVVDFSPAGSGRRVLVQDRPGGDDKGYYIASFWESKVYKAM